MPPTGAKPRRWRCPWDSPDERAHADGATGRVSCRGTVDEPGQPRAAKSDGETGGAPCYRDRPAHGSGRPSPPEIAAPPLRLPQTPAANGCRGSEETFNAEA